MGLHIADPIIGYFSLGATGLIIKRWNKSIKFLDTTTPDSIEN